MPAAAASAEAFTPTGVCADPLIPGDEIRIARIGYDSRDRLVSVSAPGGSATYGYDTNHLRVRSQIGSGDTLHLVARAEELADYPAAGEPRLARYDHDPVKADALLAQKQSSGKVHAFADALGSVYGLVDSSGSPQATYSYDAYGGRSTVLSSASTDWGFTGRRHEALPEGEIYYRLRQYDSTTGTLLQPDPLPTRTADVSLYSYVMGRPTFFTDPSGAQLQLDSYRAAALTHPWLIIDLMVIAGVITVSFPIPDDCEKQDKTVQIFWRGDSYERAYRSVELGFAAAGVGTAPDNQLGPGLYMTRDRKVAESYGQKYPQAGIAGALLEIMIATRLWGVMISVWGAQDSVGITAMPGKFQSFVPAGPPLEFFDSVAARAIADRY